MAYPISQIEKRFAKATLENKPVKVIDWATSSEVQEIINVLKEIDPGYDIVIRSWGNFKSHMPVLYEFFKTHVFHHDYMTEISICDKDDCQVCRKFGKSLRTPHVKDGLSHYTLLRRMDRPVNDPGNPGHFVPASKTSAFIAEKRMSFDQLKKELPPLDKDPFQAEETKADKKADDAAGGTKLFKGDKVRDIAICNGCNFPRAIFSMHQLKSKKLKLTSQEQNKRLQQLKQFKENYTCGDTCPVEGYETRRILRCGHFVETQYFTFAKSRDDWNADICCYCCNEDNLLSVDQIKIKFNIGGKQPLHICEYCSSLEIMPPTTNASTNFVEKKAQHKNKKKQGQDEIVQLGFKKSRK